MSQPQQISKVLLKMIQNKKLLILTEKYCDLNPSLGTTSAYTNIVGSLRSAQINNIKIKHYDEYLFSNNKPIDDYLIEEIKTDKPDYVFCSYYPFYDNRNVKLSTFEHFRNNGIPVIFIWFDFGHEAIRRLANDVGNSVGNLNVVVDTFDQVNSGNFIPMWVPQDENLFVPLEKTIEVSFVGTTNGYNTRKRYLDFLKTKLPIHISGGQREHCLSIEEYAATLGKSKITLNFPDKPDGIIQAKCRIFESMLCGTLLLEKNNDAIKKWFEPLVHYVPFDSEEDLYNKINYYLNNTDEYNVIVNNAKNKMKEYSSLNWWTKVLERAV
jgi:phage terminase large subunit-like protein